MPIKVLINGAKGRMGQVTSKILHTNRDFLVVGETGRGDKLGAAIKKAGAEVVVDFTRPEIVYKNALAIIQAGAHPVIGTTGLTSVQIKKLTELCKKAKLGGIIAPNFSIGMILLMRYAAEIVKYFPQVEIIEMHHDRKADSPSGTAIFTAETIAASRSKIKTQAKKIHENIPGSRGAEHQGIPIHAIRLPGLMAHEQIIFGDLGETLTLKHDTMDRQCFMRGIILACKRVVKLKNLVYGLDKIL